LAGARGLRVCYYRVMKLVVLGSGTSVAHSKRRSPGYWLETENGSVLLDCSTSAVHAMARENLDWPNLEAIWISHFHLDHVGGIAPFLFGTRHAPKMKNRLRPLKIFGPSGVRRLLEAFSAVNNYKLFDQPFELELIEVEHLDEFEILAGAKTVAVKTPHTDESLAIYIRDSAGKTFVYTGDTGPSMVIGDLAGGADLLLMECSFPFDKPTEKHLNLQEAMHIVRYAKPRQTILTHLYAEWDGVDFESEAARFSPFTKVLQASDGMRVEF
jgi:ribonuclease BN (tRNA processing enzyme)